MCTIYLDQIGSKRKVLITTLRFGHKILLRSFIKEKSWFEDRYLNTTR